MRKSIPFYFLTLCFVALSLLSSCRSGEQQVHETDSTTVTTTERERNDGNATTIPDQTPTLDTSAATPAVNNLPPVATPVEPDRLSAFLPELSGYTADDVQKETRIRSNMKVSKASRVYKNGDKKVTVTINDYAYVPSQYMPYEQYRGEYLQDDNTERTEATKISGYEAVQTWLKKENRAEITLFPGKRYVVQIVADQMNDVAEARRILDGMNLTGLEGLE